MASTNSTTFLRERFPHHNATNSTTSREDMIITHLHHHHGLMQHYPELVTNLGESLRFAAISSGYKPSLPDVTSATAAAANILRGILPRHSAAIRCQSASLRENSRRRILGTGCDLNHKNASEGSDKMDNDDSDDNPPVPSCQTDNIVLLPVADHAWLESGPPSATPDFPRRAGGVREKFAPIAPPALLPQLRGKFSHLREDFSANPTANCS